MIAKRSFWIVVVMITVGFNAHLFAALSGKEILAKIDDNFKAKNLKMTASIVIHGRRKSRTVKSRSWREGNEKSFTEYIAPAREKGTKMLKLENELWIYTPSADRTIKIAGHMLRQSMMGSDVSYEDFMEDDTLEDLYDVSIEGEEGLDGRLCYILKLTAAKEGVTYYSRKIWVDKQRFLALQEERYARSGKLMKRIKILEVFKIGERWYPKRINFKDVMIKGKGTEYVIESIEFDIDIPAMLFTKASLRR